MYNNVGETYSPLICENKDARLQDVPISCNDGWESYRREMRQMEQKFANAEKADVSRRFIVLERQMAELRSDTVKEQGYDNVPAPDRDYYISKYMYGRYANGDTDEDKRYAIFKSTCGTYKLQEVSNLNVCNHGAKYRVVFEGTENECCAEFERRTGSVPVKMPVGADPTTWEFRVLCEYTK
jgi:hypothetical protein